ncbi:MAG: DNA repair protein RadC [Lachnospiraceae bacterium]|nr:DNA repair protein RadC [Lachnospiraceae bacterium]
MKNKKSEGPYEKFLRFGGENLTESELLAIILRTGCVGEDAESVASAVLELGRYPRKGLLGLVDVSIEELQAIDGIGPVKAVKLKAVAELSARMSRARAEVGFDARSPEKVADFFMEELRHLQRERLVLVCLDSKNMMISESVISEGRVNTSFVSPREIFIEALKRRAVRIILIHNHPSGSVKPSRQDDEVTERILKLGIEIGIPLIDHIIIGDGKYYSYLEYDRLT